MIKLKDLLLENKIDKLFYHVSKKRYKIGDIIQPYFDVDKYSDFDSKQIREIVEDLLEKENRGKTSRNKSIFLFKNLSDARQYSKDMENRNIYKVKSLDVVKWHDMNWVDHLFGKLAQWSGINLTKENYTIKIPKDNLKNLIRYAKYYWQGNEASKLVSGYFHGSIWESITNKPVKVIYKIKN
jgi:hypothetical protein